ncbi:hypothetical protein GWO09_31430 [candidate division KSB1 bacterium]|nr:hypothetical protein [candidate division KSB1 bacterium]
MPAIKQKFAGEPCPVCRGYGWLRCAECEEGEVAFLGGYQQCARCVGSGVCCCPVCESKGKIEGETDRKASKVESAQPIVSGKPEAVEV